MQSILSLLYDFLFLLFIILLEPRLEQFIRMHAYDASQESTTHIDKSFGILLVSAAYAQFAGALFLGRSISAILSNPSRDGTGNGGFAGAIFLIVMHFTLFGVMMVFDGLKYIFGDLFSGSIWVNIPVGILTFLAVILPTAAIIAVSFPKSGKIVFQPVKDSFFQIAGTLLIFFSACVATTLFWTLLVADVASALHSESFLANIFVVILFFFAFLLLYLPPRYVLLITDYRSRFTWLRIGIIFLPFAYEVFTGKILF